MNSACHQFRERWLGRLDEDATAGTSLPSHAQACGECAAWVRSVDAQIRLFATLTPYPAPEALEAEVRRNLEPASETPLVRALRSLPVVPAPDALAERIAQDLAAREEDDESQVSPVGVPRERQERNANLLRMLPIQPAPAVLDRLVAEEMASPERHRVNRFSDLERQTAPVQLARRLDRSLRLRALRKAMWGPVATLAAAGLLVWVALQGEGLGEVEAGTPRVRSFQVTRVTHVDQLGPMARGFVGALSPASLLPPAGARPDGADSDSDSEDEVPR